MTAIFLKAALVGDVWVLYLLILASLVSVAVMVDRWAAFRGKGGKASQLMDGIARHLEKHDVEGALKLARASSSMEAAVAAGGLEHFAKGPASAEEVMASRMIQERLFLEKNLIILGTLGNNAPFLGLFGTVLGIIKAFNDLAVTGSSGAAVVMAGVSSALIATAFGILVAIPAVVANNYFQTRLREMVSNAQSLSRVVLAYMKRQGR